MPSPLFLLPLLLCPGLHQETANKRRISVPSAHCSIVVPPGFERELVQDQELHANRPRQYVGQIGGYRARLIVQLGEDRFSTISRCLAARIEDGTIEEVIAFRHAGKVICRVRRGDRERGEEIQEILCCPFDRPLSVAIVFEHSPSQTARNEANLVLASFALLPASQITRAELPKGEHKKREINIGFTEQDAPHVRVLESEHYRLYSTASGSQALLELLEAKVLPKLHPLLGSAPPSRNKLPIFLHRTRRGYMLAALRNGIPREQAMTMEAHAWDRYMSASYASPRDPVLVHEATHQFLTAELGLDGGGPWLQEGIARWIESGYTREQPERTARHLVSRKQLPRLKDLIESSNLFRLKVAGKKLAPQISYNVAASLIAFIAERYPMKLKDFVLQCGVLPAGDLRLTEAASYRCLETDLSKLEAKWQQWLLD
ncbi:MAG: hypothetical protein CSA62_10690 [Planctomycetota bacterium]|nr:MAG: hypothetical protein CSA62_10690 [Planctomycetota bacterium]